MNADTRLSDPGAIKALAHPARLAILEYLGARESATATECAEVTGLSPSATSYHLRALARYGLVTEADGTDKRERRWSAPSRGFRTEDDQAGDPALRSASRLLVEQVMARDDRRYREYLEREDTEPPEWWNATMFVDSRLRMTADEMRTLSAAIAELVGPYARGAREAPDGARDVQFSHRLFPLPDA